MPSTGGKNWSWIPVSTVIRGIVIDKFHRPELPSYDKFQITYRDENDFIIAEEMDNPAKRICYATCEEAQAVCDEWNKEGK